MRVTLPYAAATRPGALPHVRVCDTARKKIVSRSLEPGRNSSMISRARVHARARKGGSIRGQ